MPGSTLKVFLALIDSLAQIANSDALFFARLSFIHSNACLLRRMFGKKIGH